MCTVADVTISRQDIEPKNFSNCEPEDSFDSQLYKLLGEFCTVFREDLSAVLPPWGDFVHKIKFQSEPKPTHMHQCRNFLQPSWPLQKKLYFEAFTIKADHTRQANLRCSLILCETEIYAKGIIAYHGLIVLLMGIMHQYYERKIYLSGLVRWITFQAFFKIVFDQIWIFSREIKKHV